MSHRIALYALPIFLLLIFAEWLWMRRRRHAYPKGEVAASLGVAIGHQATNALYALGLGALGVLVESHALLAIDMTSAWSWAALFVSVEFVYYWFHRWSHECRWMWGSHAVHHSANRMNFPAAYRLAWTGPLSGGYFFFLPLVYLGFPAVAVFGMLGANLVFQFFLHTEMVGKLGPLELVFNTPSHHRVHHASNTRYLDANYGGVLIVFDRLFGTFVEESAAEPCRYGLTTPLETTNPVKIALHEWIAIARDVRAAPTWRARFAYAFGRPGWSHDGSRMTTAMLRRAAGLVAAEPRPDEALAGGGGEALQLRRAP